MPSITIMVLFVVYLFSLVSLAVIVDEGHEAGRFTEKEYRTGVRWALVPGVNTLLLILNLATWLTYRLSYGRK